MSSLSWLDINHSENAQGARSECIYLATRKPITKDIWYPLYGVLANIHLPLSLPHVDIHASRDRNCVFCGVGPFWPVLQGALGQGPASHAWANHLCKALVVPEQI